MGRDWWLDIASGTIGNVLGAFLIAALLWLSQRSWRLVSKFLKSLDFKVTALILPVTEKGMPGFEKAIIILSKTGVAIDKYTRPLEQLLNAGGANNPTNRDTYNQEREQTKGWGFVKYETPAGETLKDWIPEGKNFRIVRIVPGPDQDYYKLIPA